MMIHIVMVLPAGLSFNKRSREIQPYAVYSTRKKANEISKKLNEKSAGSKYWVTSKEVKE